MQSANVMLVLRLVTFAFGAFLFSLAFSDNVSIAGGPGFGVTELLLLGAGIFNLLAALLGGNLLLGWILCQVSIAATLAVAELALRLTVAPRYLSPYQLNDRYLYELVPGAIREHRHLPVNGGSQVYRVNSLGFRGEEFAAERDSRPRVVVYGDSFIHAEYTALENTLANQLSIKLTRRLGEAVEVINAGVAGFGPDQVLMRVETELDWLQPDVLVVGVFTGNDFGDLLRNKLYRLDDNGSLLENDFEFSEEIRLNAALETSELLLRKVGREAKAGIQLALRGGLPPPSSPAKLTVDRLEQHIREYNEYIEDGDNVVRDLRTDPYSADIALLPASPSARYKLELMDAVLKGIADNARARDIPLIIVAIPHPMDVLGGEHASGAVNVEDFPEYMPSRLTDSIAEIAVRRNIDHVNLFSHFRDHPDPAGLYLLGGDDHWNDPGQAFAADIIADFIAGHDLLSPRDDQE